MKEQKAGLTVAELCRRHGISQQTLYRWRTKYEGLEVSEARSLRELEEENRQLKHALAESILDVRALKAVLSKKIVELQARRAARARRLAAPQSPPDRDLSSPDPCLVAPAVSRLLITQ